MRALALMTLASCTYEAPVDEGTQLLNTLTGSVVYAGGGPPANTYVTLFRADDPPPPAGTGRPLTFASVSEAAFTEEDAGIPAAPFSLTRIDDGSYLLFAIMDRDGDFNPFSGSLAGATCGDVGGAHISDLITQAPAPVSVSGGRLVSDITILLGSPYTYERPAFTLRAEPLSLQAIAAGQQAPLLRAQASPVDSPFSEGLRLSFADGCEPQAAIVGCTEQPFCPCSDPLPSCATSIPLLLSDSDGDGLTDPYPAPEQAAAGLLDIWPRTYLEYTGPLERFTYEGRELPERWVAEAFPLAGEILTLAGYAQIPPAEAAGQLGLPIGAIVPLHDLSITFVPAFRHYHQAGADGVDNNGPYDLLDLREEAVVPPFGRWSVTLVSSTGQTWTVPNELAALPSPDAAQGTALELTP